MSKAVLEFNLEDEDDAFYFKMCVQAKQMHAALYTIASILRRHRKYGNYPEDLQAIVEAIETEINEEIGDLLDE